MPLSAGERIGSYEIVAPIGAGGMGEVYRAHDSKLGRDAAIKVLPAAVARDPERLARFEREAKVLAALNHPNIAAIYGLEETASGARAIVMEMVEGPTLADRLQAGPLDLETALQVALPIIDALEAAHDKGIVHRDLKPANVKAPVEGTVKVLDLGLATALPGADPDSSDAANSPTLTIGGTEIGTIMGTAGYMSPEQASGRRVDKRADIWSFGVVLWEMLTGKHLFGGGETISHTLADVLRAEIDFGKLPAGTPEAIRGLLKRCLDRDVKTRLRDIGEARVVIARWLANPGSGTEVPLQAEARSTSSANTKLAWVAAGVLAVAGGGLALVHFREQAPEQRAVRFQIPSPEKTSIQEFALSPDGRYLAFVDQPNNPRQLWIRALDTLEAHPLPGTEGASMPFWSPDSAYIGFFASTKLKKVAVTGGPAVSLCDAANFRGGTWNRENVILFSQAGSLFRVPAAGGTAAPVLRPKGSENYQFPSFLPGGKFLYSDVGEMKGILAGSLDGAPPASILPDISNAVYAPPSAAGGPGHLLFRRGNTLMALPFDADKLRAAGDVFPLAERVGFARIITLGLFSVSQNGTLAYGGGVSGTAGSELAWRDRSGKRVALATKRLAICCMGPSLSSDDTRALVPVFTDNANVEIWLEDLIRGTSSRFTFTPNTGDAVWSPEGTRVAAGSRGADGTAIYVKPTSGGPEQQLFRVGPAGDVWDWSRDGKFLVGDELNPKTKNDLWLLPLEGDHKPVPYLQTPFNETQAAFSPDGKWMAYQSDESGPGEVWVQSIPAGKGRSQISTQGGAYPQWRRDGKELFYVEGTKLVAVPMKLTAASVDAGKPEVLFDGVNGRFQVSADGRRFLVTVPVEGESAAAPVTVVLNWVSGVKK